MAAKILFQILLCRTCIVYKFSSETLEQKLNKWNRIYEDRIEITQAECNLRHHKHNVTEIGATK